MFIPYPRRLDPTPPRKLAMEYTAAEARAFLDAYRPLLERHRRRMRPAYAAGAGFGLCILVSVIVPAAWQLAFAVAAFA